ncbi:MAG: hypothetical protein P8075_00030 [Deltaproteobacteria bacterium]|jgi:hypothetical protein
MGRRWFNWMLVLHLAGVFLAGPLCLHASADGFSAKLIQIDGMNSQGTLDEHNGLQFVGLGLWNGPLILTFSPSVRKFYNLGTNVETETDATMGKYTVTFRLSPKSRKANNQNLTITVIDRWNAEIESEVSLTSEAAGVAIEVATTKKPVNFRISYATPAPTTP